MKIDSYELVKQLFTLGEITIYETFCHERQQRFMLRLFYPKKDQKLLNVWFDRYNHFQHSQSNHIHIANVYAVNLFNGDQAYAIVDYSSGTYVNEQNLLFNHQVEQLVSAITHLHRNNVVHGNLQRENIWITDEGNVILYGVAESKVLRGNDGDVKQDIDELVNIIDQYSLIDDRIKSILRSRKLSSAEEILSILREKNDNETIEKSQPVQHREHVGTLEVPVVNELQKESGQTKRKNNLFVKIFGVAIIAIIAFYFINDDFFNKSQVSTDEDDGTSIEQIDIHMTLLYRTMKKSFM